MYKKCIVLPCEIGDTLYTVSNNGIEEWGVFAIITSLNSRELRIRLQCKHKGTRKLVTFGSQGLGKRIFTSYEEAEQALRERNDETR